jgi:hypothetical protein
MDDDILADPGWIIEVQEGMRRWLGFSMFDGRILSNFLSDKIPLFV